MVETQSFEFGMGWLPVRELPSLFTKRSGLFAIFGCAAPGKLHIHSPGGIVRSMHVFWKFTFGRLTNSGLRCVLYENYPCCHGPWFDFQHPSQPSGRRLATKAPIHTILCKGCFGNPAPSSCRTSASGAARSSILAAAARSGTTPNPTQ